MEPCTTQFPVLLRSFKIPHCSQHSGCSIIKSSSYVSKFGGLGAFCCLAWDVERLFYWRWMRKETEGTWGWSAYMHVCVYVCLVIQEIQQYLWPGICESRSILQFLALFPSVSIKAMQKVIGQGLPIQGWKPTGKSMGGGLTRNIMILPGMIQKWYHCLKVILYSMA